MRIGIIGEKNMVLAFRDLGMTVFGVEVEEDFLKAKEEIEKENFAVIFVTETIAKKYDLEDFYLKTLPAVLVIPGAKGSLGEGATSLKKTLERALGSELNI